MSLREHLQGIYDDHGRLTPDLVVEVARPKNHPLHDRFEWNNGVAGEAYRRIQAQELIRTAKVSYKKITDETERTLRAFHAVRGEDPENGGYSYEPVDVIADDPLKRAMLLRDMERDWQALKRRWQEFAEFIDLIRHDLDDAAA